MMEDFVPPERLCEYLHVSDDTMRKWMLAGMPYVQVGRVLRFKLSLVDEWLAAQTGSGQCAVVPIRERKAS